ncbi:hypothetical protein [Flavobacteriaceae bacterium 14752]|uniref:hypothetical protein n=1 Tax=Mesohalobacter salilacus TaxID=2491711 RepID=UPI000F644552|nr:hypothetical protein EIG84_12175 [Flavobacteriaceae bacterium 14752]
MKKLIFLLILFPTILSSQELENPEDIISYNGTLIDQLAQVSSMSINPYTAVFFTSICSKFGIHNDYVKTHPFYNNWIVVSLFGFLFLFTLIVRPTLALSKFTNVIKLADEYLEDKAALVINGVIIILPIILSSNPSNDEVVLQAGIFSLDFKSILIIIATTYYLMVVLAVKYFIELLIFISPVPLVDSFLEVFKIVLTVILVFISIYSPVMAFIISLIFFIIGLFFYQRAKRLTDKVVYLFIYPVFDLMKNSDKILYDKENDLSIKILLINKTNKFKKGKILRLTKNNNEFGLEQKKLIRPNKFEPLEIKNCDIIQTDFNISIVAEDGTNFLLNRSFNKHIDFLIKEFDTENLIDKRVKLTKAKSFLGKIKNLFSKSDLKNFKMNFK